MANQEYESYMYHFPQNIINTEVEKSTHDNKSKVFFMEGVHFAEHEIPVILDDFLKYLFVNRRIKGYNPHIIQDFLKTLS